MLDDLLGQIFGEAISRNLSNSRRAQLLARCFFGLLGTGLAAVGVWHFASQAERTDNTAMWLSMLAVFVFMGCFCLFNVTLARPWRWPGRGFVASVAALFVTRILFGA